LQLAATAPGKTTSKFLQGFRGFPEELGWKHRTGRTSMSNHFVSLRVIGLIALHAAVSHAASTIEFAATNYTGIEGGGVQLQLVVDPPVTTTNARVRVAQTGGSAGAGDFYGYSGYPDGTILIPASQSQVSVWVSLTDDGLPESDETIEFTLTNPAGDLVLGPRTRAVVTIQNARPFFSLSWSSGFEATGVDVHCARTGDTNVAFTVDYVSIANGTAAPGVNFVPTNGTIAVGAGVREVSFVLPALNDGVVNDPGAAKTFGFYLANATAGVTIDTTPTKLSIADSQWPTTLDLNYQPPVSGGYLSRFSVAPNGQMVALEFQSSSDVDPVYRLVSLNADGSLEARSLTIVFGNTNSWVEISKVAIQADGKVLVLGNFTIINGVPLRRPGFARLSADGALDTSFVPAVSPDRFWEYGGPALKALTDGRILVFDGTLRALKSNGEIDPNFQAIGPARLHSFAEDAQGKLIVAGGFAPGDGSGPVTIVRMNRDGSLDSTFSPASAVMPGERNTVDTILPMPDGKLLIAGTFLSVNGVNRTNLARLDSSGLTDETFDAGSALLDGVRLSPIILNDDKILLVFAQYGSYGWNGSVQRLNSDGSLDGQFPVRLYSGGDWEDVPRISAMTIDSGKLLVAGYLATVNGIHRKGLARLLLDDAPQSAAVIAPNWPAFWTPTFEGFEGMGEAKVTVRRLGDVRGAATVNYRTQDGSANAGQDYTALVGTLSFAPLEMEKSFRLPILNDTEFESDETVELVLSPGSGVAAVGPKTLFTIHDDEVTVSELQFHHDINGVPPYVSFTFNSVPDQVYFIERSTDLKSWQQVDSVQIWPGSTPAYHSTWDGAGLFASSKWFFRVRRQ
jgi:uncharacterized delta-60 repeat protein